MTAHFALDPMTGLREHGKPAVGNIRWPIDLRDTMTPRQLEIMLKLCEGKVNKQIAYELDVSTATVKVHIRNAITRLGAKNRVNAVAIVAANSAIFRNAIN
ncbi:helix-turn-helix domain-containing protein [Roseibium salinum]|uniref:Helix-turn-helix transcriptional regulator n=1 Tax=Roseibium salinum TaxID=1604349 RepID=A0ABT3R841_9HYPH|nr:helix-turn-helix transcriptional regulator [Roseibium sp. DSM 29163]MCX2725266.1 helix-turn-helix transcriptional regulator [Roseibium sp. DSM 29163]MDN3720874.1 helix-turn-helix transcriptional regulator [Roseibium salinum]